MLRFSPSAIILAVLLVSPARLPAAPLEAPPSFLMQWQTTQDRLPYGLASDQSSRVYLVDLGFFGQTRTMSGANLFSWGAIVPGVGGDNLRDVAVASDGRIYAVGNGASGDRLWEFGAGGEIVRFGAVANMPTLTSVAVLNDSTLLIAGLGNVAGRASVLECARNGSVRTPWGIPLPQGQLDIAVSPTGHVVVADFEANSVWVFTSSGEFVRTWGSLGFGEGQFSGGPSGVACDAAGNVYAVDTGNDRVQKFRMDGTFLCQWGGPTSPAASRLASPMAIAVDPLGRVLVGSSDPLSTWPRTVKIFQSNVTSTAKRSWGAVKAQRR